MERSVRWDQESERSVVTTIARIIERRLPRRWMMDVELEPVLERSFIADAIIIIITAPDGTQARFVAEAKRRISTPDIAQVLEQIRRVSADMVDRALPLVLAPYLAPRTRAALAEREISYADATGNLMLIADRPGLWVVGDGAATDPEAAETRFRSLKGPRSGRAVRAVVETRPPFGIRQLALRTGVPAPTVSRVVTFLEREAVVERSEQGSVVSVDWQGVLRRWSLDYAFRTSNWIMACLDPRGIAALASKIMKTELTYAVTGAFAAERIIPFAPARTITIFTPDAALAREWLGLRETDSGANVLLAEPFDPIVFDRTVTREGLTCANPAQIAADLLTGPGREPSTAEELMKWMEANQDVWRS